MVWETYEISLWSHDDKFISILAQSGQYYSREAFNPIFKINTNGEINLSFTIPIIIFNKETNQWEDNTLWYNTLKTNNSLANEQKIKLIFDKNKKNNDGSYAHTIYETVIINLTERRDGRQLYCDVQCTGYAFKWLGKTGYTITLDSETVLLDEEENNITVYPTISYWLDKIFPKNDDGTWATSWGYEIRMNYSGIGGNRDSSKIYEDDDIINWTEDEDTLIPIYNSEPIEKQRFPTISESNKYNITQDLAELFEVFIRYDFLYEDINNPFKITRGIVVFYNEMPEYTEYAITYQDNEVGLSKTSDSNDIVTKLYVPEIESEYSDNGYITIADAPNNITKDNFILNFDYFIQSGQLSTRQQNAIPQYQKDIRSINTKLAQTLSMRNSIEDSIIDNEIIVNTILSKIEASQSTINDYTDKLSTINNNLTSNVLTDNKVAYIVSENDNKLLVTFKRGGVIENSIKCETENVTFSIYSKDNYGYIKAIEVNGTNKGNIVYFTYQYDLLSYYRNEIETYTSIKESLTQQYEEKNNYLGDSDTKIAKEDGSLYEQYNYYVAQYKNQAKRKEKITLDFENLMGYFLKEGNWNTTDYEAPAESKQINNCTIVYDEQALNGEQLSYYLVGTSETKTYYNYIDITSIQTLIPNIEELVIIDKWSNNNIDYTKQYLYNAQYTPQFMKVGNNINFILLLDSNINIDINTHTLYYINTVGEEINITSLYRSGSTNKNNLVYRRYIINDENIITSSIKIANGGVELDEYYDYTITLNNTLRVITFKCNNKVLPNYSNFTIYYKCDRTTSQFFYDAQDVAATSAFPTTSYEVSFIYLQKRLNITPKISIDSKYKTISNKLNDNIDLRLGSIVRINDHQLNFYGVKGIVSEISLDLERNQNNSFVIQNYKTRFEDLFGRIVASSEQMKANSISYNRAASAILPTQQIVGNILQNTINSNSLIFNSGYTSGVTFSDEGIIVENNYPYMNGVTGQVILKGGGIFLSDSVDADGTRIFHTGITPAGINASVLTTGRIDTEKINIYSGDQVRFAWISEGIFAYGQNDDGATLYDTYVRYNENGLLYSNDGFKAVELGWNGLYLGAQDGSVELTANDGLSIYNGNIDQTNRVALVKLGRFGTSENYEYGLRLYNIDGKETLITSNSGELWLKRSIIVGNDNGIVGITGEGESTDTYNPIRIWAGNSNKVDAPFWVKEDGSIRAENAYIKGEIHATSGEFSGTISANDGTIGGWIINKDSISSGGIILSPAVYNESGEIITQASISVGDLDKDHTIISGDGTLTASGVNITGEIHATSGEFTGTITATGGKIGNLTIQNIEDISNTVDAIEGDKTIFRVEIKSSNGNVTYYNKQFTTVLTANAYIGNIPLSDSDYNNYNFKWEKSTDGNTWEIIDGKTTRSWSYQNIFTEQQYIRCIMTKKS